MATWFKLGVFGTLRPEAAEGFRRVERLYAQKGRDLHVTSIREGTHSPGSLHWSGNAWDQRKDRVTPRAIRSVLDRDFDVVDERTHIHIEYDPKE